MFSIVKSLSKTFLVQDTPILPICQEPLPKVDFIFGGCVLHRIGGQVFLFQPLVNKLACQHVDNRKHRHAQKHAGTPNSPPPTSTAKITQKALMPMESPKILGPKILPSNCCKSNRKMPNQMALMGDTKKIKIKLGIAPMNGPK